MGGALTESRMGALPEPATVARTEFLSLCGLLKADRHAAREDEAGCPMEPVLG